MLPALVDVAAPPSAPLHTVALDGGALDANELWRPSSRLAGITKLSLLVRARPSLAAVLHELLPRLPRLAHLHINRAAELGVHMKRQMPTADAVATSYDALQVLASQGGLNHLGLWFCALPDLPACLTPCLQGEAFSTAVCGSSCTCGHARKLVCPVCPWVFAKSWLIDVPAPAATLSQACWSWT